MFIAPKIEVKTNKIAELIANLAIFCFFALISQLAGGETLERAESLYKVGDLKGSEAEVVKYLGSAKSLTDQAEGLKFLGIVRFTKGETKQAEAHFKEALSLNSGLTIDRQKVLDDNVVAFFEQIKQRLKQVSGPKRQIKSKTAGIQRNEGPLKNKASLKVYSVPMGAKIMIDGIFAGESGQVLSLAPGSTQIEIVADGYLTEKKSIQIKPGEAKIINVKLKARSSSKIASTSFSNDKSSPRRSLGSPQSNQKEVKKSVVPSEPADDLFMEQPMPSGQSMHSAGRKLGPIQETEFDKELAIEKARLKKGSETQKLARTKSVSPPLPLLSKQSDSEMKRQSPSVINANKPQDGVHESFFEGTEIQRHEISQQGYTQNYLYAPAVDNENAPVEQPTTPNVTGKKEKLASKSENQSVGIPNKVRKKSHVTPQKPSLNQEAAPVHQSQTVAAAETIPDPAYRKETSSVEPGIATILPFGIGQMSQKRYAEGSILLLLQSGLLFLGTDRTMQAERRELDLQRYVEINCSPVEVVQDSTYKNCQIYLEREYQSINKMKSEGNYALIGFGVLALGGIIEAIIWEPPTKQPKKKPSGSNSKINRQKRKSQPYSAEAASDKQDPFTVQPVFTAQGQHFFGVSTRYEF